MKTTTTRTLAMTLAVLALGGAVAYAQNPVTVTIPFQFRTAAGTQASGQYWINSVSISAPILRLQSQLTLKSTLLGLGQPSSEYNSTGPRLTFYCGSRSGCVLTHVWFGDGRGVEYPRSGFMPGEIERVAVVYFDRAVRK